MKDEKQKKKKKKKTCSYSPANQLKISDATAELFSCARIGGLFSKTKQKIIKSYLPKDIFTTVSSYE